MKKQKYNAPLGASLVVLSSVFYASYGIWTTLIGNFSGGYTITAIRSVLVVLILIPIVSITRSWEPLKLKKNWPYLLTGLVTSLVVWGPLYYSILHNGIGTALTVNYASIILGLFVLGALFGGERFTKDKLISAVLGIIGLALVFSPTSSHVAWLGLGAALLAGFGQAGNMIAAKHISYKTPQTSLSMWVIGVFANIFMAMVLKESLPPIGADIQWLYILLFSIVSVAASLSIIRGLKIIDAGAAGILGLSEIVFGILFGVVFFHEHPTPTTLLGAAVIILAAAIPYVKDYNAERGTLS